MPRKISAAEARQNWEAGLGNATTKIEAGIRRVTVAPGAKAAQNKDKYLAGVQQSANLWAQRVQVDLGTWQQRALEGVSRVASGAAAKGSKYESNVAPVFAHMDSVLATVDSMPNQTLDQRIAKMGAFARGMAGYKSRAGR